MPLSPGLSLRLGRQCLHVVALASRDDAIARLDKAIDRKAQQADAPKRLTLQTLFQSPEFAGEYFQGGRGLWFVTRGSGQTWKII